MGSLICQLFGISSVNWKVLANEAKFTLGCRCQNVETPGKEALTHLNTSGGSLDFES
jgi:hypothetical protein